MGLRSGLGSGLGLANLVGLSVIQALVGVVSPGRRSSCGPSRKMSSASPLRHRLHKPSSRSRKISPVCRPPCRHKRRSGTAVVVTRSPLLLPLPLPLPLPLLLPLPLPLPLPLSPPPPRPLQLTLPLSLQGALLGRLLAIVAVGSLRSAEGLCECSFVERGVGGAKFATNNSEVASK